MLDRENKIDRRVIDRTPIIGDWEVPQRNYLGELLLRLSRTCLQMRFLDIGAHWGYYSLLALQSGYFTKIDAFEPDPLNYAQLQTQLMLNHAVVAINAHRFAITQSLGSLPWALSSTHPNGNRGGVGVDERGNLRVEGRTLDSVISPDGSIIVAKIDVEGHEREAIKGARRVLTELKAVLQIESYDYKNDVEALMRELGYKKIKQIKSDHYFSNIGELN